METEQVRYHGLPRNVRPSFLTAQVDGLKSDIATGPKSRNGRLAAQLAVRVADGIVDRFIEVEAIASRDGTSTIVRVSVRGRVIHEESVSQSGTIVAATSTDGAS